MVQNEIVIEKLQDAALRANKIMTHTLQLIKLYLLHCYDKSIEFPKIDRQFVTSVMKVLCKEPKTGRPPKEETKRIKDKLKSFYEAHYEAYIAEKLDYTHLNTVLDYLAIDVITMYENNIKVHYVEYVKKFVNVSWNKKEAIAEIKASETSSQEKRASINVFISQLQKISQDLMSSNQPKTASPLYHSWIDEQRCKILPQKTF